MADTVLVNAPQVTGVPYNYTIPGSSEIALTSVQATFDGSGAGASFLPALQIIGPGGVVAATFVNPGSPIASGGSAEVTFGTFLGGAASSGSLTVRDSTHIVSPVSTIRFTSGATVSDAGGGQANVAISGGGGVNLYYQANEGISSYGQAVTSGIPLQLTWAHVGGASWLNYTAPSAPSFVGQGLYTVSVFVSGSGFTWPASGGILTLTLGGSSMDLLDDPYLAVPADPAISQAIQLVVTGSWLSGKDITATINSNSTTNYTANLDAVVQKIADS